MAIRIEKPLKVANIDFAKLFNIFGPMGKRLHQPGHGELVVRKLNIK
jgi:hypothetical protein